MIFLSHVVYILSSTSSSTTSDTLINKDLAMKFFHDVGKRVHESILWLGSIPRHLVQTDGAVSHSDAHIVLNVFYFLNNTHHHMHNHHESSGVNHFRSLLTHGHQCTPEQAKIQKSIQSIAGLLDICSEIEWYKLAHLAWPQARTIMVRTYIFTQ
jgi:hypothetical protein